MPTSPTKPIVILGCTASGKSDLAESLARALGAPQSPVRILAVDSMQVYRGMNIGTAKPPPEIRAQIPYLMLDIADPWETYSAARFVSEARPHLTLEQPLIIVAGTILYLRALLDGLFEGPSADSALREELNERARVEGTTALHAELARLDPLAAGRIHANDLRRIVRALEVYRLTGKPISELQTQWSRENPPAPATFIGIRREKEALSRRINSRVKKMVELGLVDEVDRLRQDPRGFSPEASSAVGYKQLLDYFARKVSLEDAIEQVKIQTRYLAKMQRTWLKRWPSPPPPDRVHWLDAGEGVEGADLLEPALSIIQQT
jgi:tRNA dimethylallyltransferase